MCNSSNLVAENVKEDAETLLPCTMVGILFSSLKSDSGLEKK